MRILQEEYTTMDSLSRNSNSHFGKSYNKSRSSKDSRGKKKAFSSKKKKRLNHKLFIGGLPPKLQDDELIEYFEKFGEIYEAQVMFDKETMKSRGFAFVTYKEAETAKRVLERPHVIQNKKVDVKIAFSKSKARTKILNERERKIFVGGLSPETTEAQLETYFEQFGDVESTNIIVEPNSQKSRGFGFIVFKDKDTIEEVLNHRDKHFLNKKWIDCKPALLREEIKRPVKKNEKEKKKTKSEAPRNKIDSSEEEDKQSEPKSTGLSLPGPISHHPHELYSEEAFSEHKSFHSREANYGQQQSAVGFSPMNFRPANPFYTDPRSAGPSPMAYPNRARIPPNWPRKYGHGMTPSTASGPSPHHRFYAESPALQSRSSFVNPRLMETATPKSTFGSYYRNQMPMASPFVRSAQNKFSTAPKNAHNFSTYFQQNEILEDIEESD